jgi:AcrR family transcriptional regulator
VDEKENKYSAVKILIRDAAAEVFERLGFEKTTVNDIADAVHKAKSSIYYYFKSKEEIFFEIVQDEIRWMMTEMAKAVESESNPTAKLRAYLMTRITQLRKVPSLRSVLADGYLRRSQQLEECRAYYARMARELLAKILNEGRRDGVLNFACVEVAAAGTLVIIKALELPILFGNRDSEEAVDIDSLVHVILDGLRTR